MESKEEFSKRFGAHLRKKREEKGWSLDDLSFEIEGHSDRHILSKIENGKVSPTIYTVEKICSALKTNIPDFFKDFKK